MLWTKSKKSKIDPVVQLRAIADAKDELYYREAYLSIINEMTQAAKKAEETGEPIEVGLIFGKNKVMVHPS